MDVSKEEFLEYERVRVSGVTNMFDVRMVQMLSSLPKDKIMFIMKNYGDLIKKYMPEQMR